jgi:hypothetical protein
MQLFRVTYLGFAGLTFVLVTLQFFLAGLGVFGATGFGAHETVGGILYVTTLLMLVTAAVGGLGRDPIVFGGVLLVLVIVQSLLPGTRDDAPGIAALHPLLAVVIWMGSYQAVMHALAWRRGTPGATS